MTAAHGGWTLRYSRRAEKDIARLDPTDQAPHPERPSSNSPRTLVR